MGDSMDRPNILLIHWHDLGRHLATYGRGGVTSPNVDRLAVEGIRFDKAFCTTPLCSPARGSLFTGRYPHANGLMGLAHLGWEYRPGVRTLPGLLGEAGYRTALAGHQHESRDAATLGFDDLVAIGGGGCGPVTDAAVGWLSRVASSDAPFFLTVGFEETHRPYPRDRYTPGDPAAVEVPVFLPDNEWTRDDLAAFQGAIRVADAAVGRVLAALESESLAARTWVVFTTDHGTAFPRAKSTLYETGVGVSLIMRPPPGWPAPRGPSDHLISHLDVLPTLLDRLGIPIPEEVDGVSHAAWLAGRDDRPPRHEVHTEKTYHDVYDPMRSVRTERYSYIRSYEERPLLVLPGDIESSPTRRGYGDHHLRHRPPEELYDLATDPQERVNRIDDPSLAGVRADLAARLDRWQETTGDPLLTGPVPGPPWPREARYGALV
jgi:arylsulfatase A-like enzyme